MASSRDNAIRIRSYNVGFGDCILVRIPEGAAKRWMLIDFGNAPGRGGGNTLFPTIAADIQKETGGHVDVLVMTHEHLDHMEGFYSQRKIFDKMTFGEVWMSLPSHPDYYKDYKNARIHKRLRGFADIYHRAFVRRGLSISPSFERLVRNNLSNADRIDYVRQRASSRKRKYLARGSRVSTRGLAGAKVRVLAPEKDVSVYYSGAHMHSLRTMAAADAGNGRVVDPWQFAGVKRTTSGAPENLSRTDWQRLRAEVQTGAVSVMHAIDKAQNNTSLVFEMEVGGRRLLFPGDAELESWAHMKTAGVTLKAVDFLKVSHHGSHNGTPKDRLDALLPKRRKAGAQILVSTKSKVYGVRDPVPDESLLKELKARGRVYNTDGKDKVWLDVYV